MLLSLLTYIQYSLSVLVCQPLISQTRIFVQLGLASAVALHTCLGYGSEHVLGLRLALHHSLGSLG
jgi:hypothetical protein